MTPTLKQTYKKVKINAPELYRECIAKASAVANNHFYGNGKRSESELASDIEIVLLEMIAKTMTMVVKSL